MPGHYGKEKGPKGPTILKPKGGFKKPQMKGKMKPSEGGPDYFSKMKKMRGMK